MENAQYRFPLFVDLRGKPVLVVGAGVIGLRRIRVLQSFGARVTVVAPKAEKLPEGVIWKQRPYEKGDLQGAFLAVAATDDRQVNFQVGQEAGAAGIPVSVADSRQESSFFFPAICQGSGLVAGVVSEGSHHARTARAAEKIRRVLEEME